MSEVLNLLDMPYSFVWLIVIASSFFFNYVFDRVLTFDCDYEAVEIRNSRIYRFFYSNRFVVAAAGITALCITLVYVSYGIFPFGDYTVMRMDLYHQYGPLFAELYDRVVNHQSFLYSWQTGGGSSFLGNYLNYLSSPLSALIFLFDKENISFAISFIVSVKCILSSAAFTYYIKKSLNSSSFVSASFGTLYAFCSYFMAYYWNVMWIDAMILFPIILLGIEQIINKGSIKTYCIAMVLLMFSSYYMAFMTCLFSVLYFFVFYSVSSSFNDKINPNMIYSKKYTVKEILNNKFINSGLKFALGSILSACICAVTLIPVFVILRGSSATSDTFPTTFVSYFDIFDFITSHFAAVEETIRSSGDDVLPNVYCGILTIILIPLYVINDKIKLKEKAAYILLLIFLLFSFDNNCLNFIWHAMHFPNDLPFRFSFMYSFVLLVMAYKTIINIKAISVRDIGFVGMGWIFFVCTAQKMATTKMSEATIYATIGFIILWTGFLMFIRKSNVKKLLLSVMVVSFVFCEFAVTDTSSFIISQPNEDYKINYKRYTEAIDYIKDNDKDFYRTELCYLETRMDPSYYGYDGISVFSSMAYEAYSQTQYSLGMFGNRVNSYTYNTQTPVYNMMFNIKYLIQTDVSLPPSDNLYKKIYTTSDGQANVYENKYHLPISYCVSEKIDDWIIEEGNPFTAQGDFFELATGYSGVFKELEYLSSEYDGLDGDEVTGNGTYWFN
ncbi:MAG: YfhO family protein, partial [Eubacterium sp.]